jgi:hypothetical protein
MAKTVLVSPRGIAVYPKLVGKPDEYQGKKFWCTKLRLTAEQVAPIQTVVATALAEHRARIAADINMKPLDKKKKLEYADASPISKELDKEGNETGFYVVAFKTNYEFKDKLGQLKTTTVPIFDAKGTPIRPASIWGGSEIKVSYEPWPYDSGSSKNIGVSLRIHAVQILKLVSGNGGSADGFGFQAEEGYVAPEQTAEAPAEQPVDGAPVDPAKPGDY